MKLIGISKTIGLILTLIPLSVLAVPTTDQRRFVETDTTTIDTVTRLQWMDVHLTSGLSYYDVLEQTKPSGHYDGYRFATGAEITELFSVFDIPDFHEPYAADRAMKFMEMFGSTEAYNLLPEYGYGLSLTGFAEAGDWLEQEYPGVPTYGVSADYLPNGYNSVTVQRAQTSYNPALSYKGFGSFLVHEGSLMVPEINGASAPLALGLLVLTVLARWERRKRIS